MTPADFHPDFAESNYQEILFTIDANQFDCPRRELPADIETRFETSDEARAAAQEAANLVGHEVEVSVDGFWGYHGREYIESFTVQPEVPEA